MSWNEQLPEWNNVGTEPPAQKKADGWQPGEKPPAGWLNWLFNRAFKCVQEIRDIFNQHLEDYIRQPGYATATGSANNYAITLNPAPAAYADGMSISVKINVDNTGASTINVNSLGAKSIKKPNGNDVAAGNLKAGSVYSMRYNGTNFILQGSDAAGDATPGDVLSGKTFSNDSDTGLTGTLALTGNAVVGDALSGKTFYNTDAKAIRTGTMPNRTGHVTAQSRSLSGTTLRLRPQAGYYPGDAGNSVQDTDNNWLAENIKSGVSIFGKTGTLPEGMNVKAIQRGVTTIVGGYTQEVPVTINAVANIDKTLVFCSRCAVSENNDTPYLGAKLTSATSLNLRRYTPSSSGTADTVVQWFVVEVE